MAKGFRTLIEGLVEKGEIEVVDSPWGREFKPPESPDPKTPADPAPKRSRRRSR